MHEMDEQIYKAKQLQIYYNISYLVFVISSDLEEWTAILVYHQLL